TAAIGRAAKRGVIIKGGEHLESLSQIKTLVLDKTGTLTYGTIAVSGFSLESGFNESEFWKSAAIAEKFSEHPIGRAIFYEAIKHFPSPPDPSDVRVVKGSGIIAKAGADEIVVGDEKILEDAGIILDRNLNEQIVAAAEKQKTKAFVFVNKKLAGAIFLADTPRPEAKKSIAELKKIGVERVVMFTGDNAQVAKEISAELGISEFLASMSPEDKLRELEKLEKTGAPVCMVGDGINDAPALSRADIGIAMGKAGTAVAVEAADVVILTDNLMRVPEMILLGRKTFSVIKTDIVIWLLSNIFGFTLVLTGVFGPALAAFYNFATDFFPLINSARLFKEKIKN
ncbi:MAG: HAD-IC family P-type ATPase, partial [Candidatus Giovannonibacteria bacterium]|nr:HAD-IC family P-type ATPase [Candidatus Giovannonibacteria bacterium]